MSTSTHSQTGTSFSFLENMILEALAQAHILAHLDEQQRQMYTAQFLALAIERIGMDALAVLPEHKHVQFAHLIKDEQTSEDAWASFWREAVPNFDAHIQKSIDQFITDLKVSAVRSSL